MQFTKKQEAILDQKKVYQDSDRVAYTALESYDFKSAHIAIIAGHERGKEYIKALQDLLKSVPDSNHQPIPSEGGQPPTQLSRLIKAGITRDMIFNVLDRKRHNCGVKCIKALQDLLEPMMDDNGKPWVNVLNHPITQQMALNNAGFTNEMIISVLVEAGSDGIKAMLGLIKPMRDKEEKLIVDAQGHPRTQLSIFAEAGFLKDMVFKVLCCHGGARNIKSLQELLEPMLDAEGLPEWCDEIVDFLTPFTKLRQVGFSNDRIVRILAHSGGSINLGMLRNLLNPIPYPVGKEGVCVSQLLILEQTGFDCLKISQILGHDGAAMALQELLNGLYKDNIRTFITSYPDAAWTITALAYCNSRSVHINFLMTILDDETFREHIKSTQTLKKICLLIRGLSGKNIKTLQPKIQTLVDLIILCQLEEGTLKNYLSGGPSAELSQKSKQPPKGPRKRSHSKDQPNINTGGLLNLGLFSPISIKWREDYDNPEQQSPVYAPPFSPSWLSLGD